MTLALDPLFLLTALAFLLPWARMAAAAKRSYYQVRLAILRRSIERRLDTRLLVLTGPMERYYTFKMIKAIYQTTPLQHITVVLDTCGGELAAGLQLLHALSRHKGRVTAVIPDEAWSSGTLVALAADVILMAPSANLGACDAICDAHRDKVLTGPVVTSAETGESIDLVRARHCNRDIIEAIREARIARGDGATSAQVLAARMVCSDADHWHPIFPEEARRMGLAVVTLTNTERWWKLIYLASRAR